MKVLFLILLVSTATLAQDAHQRRANKDVWPAKVVDIWRRMSLPQPAQFAPDPEAPVASTYYVSPTGSGTACTIGSPCTLSFAVGGGSSPVAAGDTVILNNGIYQYDNVNFLPSGVSQYQMTVFQAANGARPIITSTANLPPTSIAVHSYTKLDGLWIGGTRTETPTGIFMGGSPVSRYVQIVNCTIFGYADGLEVGSAEYYLIQGNRFVDCGQGTFNHCIYASGNNTPPTEPNHAIIDNNLFVAGGGGYAVHYYPNNKTGIITRNRVYGPGNWGYAIYGNGQSAVPANQSILVAGNFCWRCWHQQVFDCSDVPIAYNIPAGDTQGAVIINNVDGPCDAMNLPSTALLRDKNAYYYPSSNPGPGAILLTAGDETNNFGISTMTIDDTVAALKASFAQLVATILSDATIEMNFGILKTAVPNTSLLYHTGYDWFGGGLINIGPDSGAPASVDAFWPAFRALGLKEYNAYGQLLPATQVFGPLKGNVVLK